MFRWVVLAFIIIPLVELYLLVWMSAAIGFWETVAIAITTGIVGGNLARREGLRVWRSWQGALQQGQAPESGVVDGMLILIGGALLFTPGVLTDTAGFTMLFPITRRPLAYWLSGVLQQRISVAGSRGVAGGNSGPAHYSSSPPSVVARATVIETTGVDSSEKEREHSSDARDATKLR